MRIPTRDPNHLRSEPTWFFRHERAEHWWSNSRRMHTMTPVIGPQCSVIKRHETHAWEQIGDHVAWLRKSLNSTDRRVLPYLDSLATARELSVPVDDGQADERIHPFLRNLQLELVRLGHDITQACGFAMASRPRAISDLPTAELEIDREVDCIAIEQDLVESCVWAQRLLLVLGAGNPTSPADPHPLFPAEACLARLVELARTTLLSGLSDEMFTRLNAARQGRGQHDASVSVVANQLVDLGAVEGSQHLRLMLANLDWVANLLWYTLRFNAEAFPTNGELAFQVSLELAPDRLNVRERGRRIEPLSMAAEIAQAQVLERWFDSYRPKMGTHPPMAQFYDSLADYLWEQHEKRLRSPELSRSMRAIAFSTTLDRELEFGFNRGRHFPFFITIPILVDTPDDPTQDEVRWAFCRVQGGDLDDPHWTPEWSVLSRGALDSIDGPLIVKLNGAPLLDTSRLRDVLPAAARPRRYFIVSESDHLDSENLLTRGLKVLEHDLADPERRFWFLGQTGREWNARLRVYDQTRSARKNQKSVTQPPDRFVAVSRQFDVRSEVLDTLGIRRLEMVEEGHDGPIRLDLDDLFAARDPIAARPRANRGHR